MPSIGSRLKGALKSAVGFVGSFIQSNPIASVIIDTIKGQLREKLSEADAAAIEAQIVAATRDYELQLAQLDAAQIADFNKRTAELEGTAKDLLSAGILGRIVLFFRGSLRPFVGYGLALVDYRVFSGAWTFEEVPEDIRPQVISAFWLVNLLVLGFWFGERTLVNVLPFVAKMLGFRGGNSDA